MGTVAPRALCALVLVHRWLGIAGCLLCVGWFASGLVLLWAPYPGFRAERPRHWAAPLDCRDCTRPLVSLLANVRDEWAYEPVRVGMWLDAPVARVRAGRAGAWQARPLDSLAVLPALSATVAASIARRALAIDAPAIDVERILEPDQWTVELGYRRELPLWRLRFSDPEGTEAYVSEAGGEVVLTSTQWQRRLAWFGAIPHWLYPRWLRSRVPLWRASVISLSGLALALALAGLVVGIATFRFRPGAGLAPSPYASAWMRWHHWAGLLFGVVTVTWLLSGLLSVDPFHWSPGDEPSLADHAQWSGQRAADVALPADAREVSAAAAARMPAGSLAELELTVVQGRPVWTAFGRGGKQSVLRGDVLPAQVVEDVGLTPGAITAALGPLLAGTIRGPGVAELLHEGDAYYAPRPGRALPLPVLRVQFSQGAHVAFYVDPRTGRLERRHDDRSRAERWLYSGLHDFDFPGVWERPALRLGLIVGFSVGGLVLSLSGCVIGVRRLRATLRRAMGPAATST